MRGGLIPITLMSLALLLTGISSCQARITSPSNGYLVVDNVFSPVTIKTASLKGAGWIEALLPGGPWTLIHFEPGGSFTYERPLPGYVWHCADPGGHEGCVARLRVGHDAGGVGNNPDFGKGIVHVCTANYVQRQGRKHCGSRDLERLSDAAFSWRGDPWNRLVVGTHAFKHVDADSPPTGTAADEVSGRFFDYRWDPENDPLAVDVGAVASARWEAYDLDLGACSFFIPWEWEHRLDDAYYTAGLGAALGNRGLAERFIDEIVDTTEPVSQHEVNALLWIDGVVGIVPNESASPEFHYRLSGDTGEPQFCFKQYFHASSDISAKPDHWYRFDQAIGAFFLELLPFVGDCGSKNVSIRYCGTPGISSGVGTFEVDQSSVHIAHQGYPWGKVLCNNEFVPSFIDGVHETFAPGGEGASQIDSGIAVLVDTLSEALDINVRRIEISPRGMYLVTAESTDDGQYGLGDCRADLDRGPTLPTASRPTETHIEYGVRGVTRF
jgi:hypothetical protein